MMEGCDLAGFNSSKFDFPLLAEEFLRADIDFDFQKRKFIDVQTIFHKMERRTLEAAYKFYCDKDLTDAHSAKADTMATYEVLKAQLDRYPELENDINFLSEFNTTSRMLTLPEELFSMRMELKFLISASTKENRLKVFYPPSPLYYCG